MGPHEMSGKRFYFDHGELLVDRTKLPEHYPSARRLDQVEQAGLEPIAFEGIGIDPDIAMITPEGVLACRREDQNRAIRMLDLLIGHRLTTTPAEARRVEAQVGVGHSLLALLRNHPTENVYIYYFDERFGTAYRPNTEPRHLARVA